MNNTNISNERIYVVSLPRTGTKTVCKMLSILGYNVKHLPTVLHERFVKEGFTAFADTPCYAYSFAKEQTFNHANKFIYIERNIDDWVSSFEGVNLHKGYNLLMNLSLPEHINGVRLLDMKSLGEIFGYHKEYNQAHFKAKYIEHKQQMQEILGERLLTFKITEGWQPLCSFLNKEVPKDDVPHLNKNVINEKIL